jgi:predicted MFS family arabinose efflux permease
MFYKTLSTQKYYPWLVAILAMLIVTTTNGLINSGITVYDESLIKEFGWTIGQLKTRDSISFFAGSLSVLAAGWAIDRYGFKPLLLVGMFLLCLGYFFYGRIHSLAAIYSLHLVFALVIACAGIMTAMITAVSWVKEKRGFAVGMTIAGTSLGGILIPPFANWLNQHYGWRTGMQIEALLPAIVFLLIALLIQNKTKKSDATAQNTVAEESGISYRMALKTLAFYQVALAGALTYYAILSLFSHLFLYMRGAGFSPKEASIGISSLAMAGFAGKLFFGWIADRINPFILLRILMFVMFLGLTGICFLPKQVWVFLIVTGFGWGGLHTLYNFILLTLFGLKEAGKINGSISLAEAMGGGLGIYLTGKVYDISGSYQAPFLLILCLMLLATVVVVFLKPMGASKLSQRNI